MAVSTAEQGTTGTGGTNNLLDVRSHEGLDQANNMNELINAVKKQIEEAKETANKIYAMSFDGPVDMAKKLIDAGVELANAPKNSWDNLRQSNEVPNDTRVLYNSLFLSSFAGKNGNFSGSNLRDLYERGVISRPGNGKLNYFLHNLEHHEIERFFQNAGRMSLAKTDSNELNEFIKSNRQQSNSGLISNAIFEKYRYRDLLSDRYQEILGDYIPEGMNVNSKGVLSDLLNRGHIEFDVDGFKVARHISRQSDRQVRSDRTKILSGLETSASGIFDATGFSGDPRVSDRNLYLVTKTFSTNYSDFMRRIGNFVDEVNHSGVPLDSSEIEWINSIMETARGDTKKAAVQVIKQAQQNSVNVSQDSPEAPSKGSKAALIASIIASAGFVLSGGIGLGMTVTSSTMRAGDVVGDVIGLLGSASSLTSSSANAAFAENQETKTLEKRIVEEFGDDFLENVGHGLLGMQKAANFLQKNGLTMANKTLRSMSNVMKNSSDFAVREGNSANALFNITQNPTFKKYRNSEYNKEVARVGKGNYLIAHYMGHKKDIMALIDAGWKVEISFASDGFASDDVDGAHENLLNKYEIRKGHLTVPYEQLPEDARFPYDLRRGRLVLTPDKDKLLTRIKDDNHISTGRAHSKDNSIQNFRDDVRKQYARHLKDPNDLINEWWKV